MRRSQLITYVLAIVVGVLVLSGCEGRLGIESYTQPPLADEVDSEATSLLVDALRKLLDDGHDDLAIARVKEEFSHAGKKGSRVNTTAQRLSSDFMGTSVGAYSQHHLILDELRRGDRQAINHLNQFLVVYPKSQLPVELFIKVVDEMVERGEGHVAAALLVGTIHAAKQHRDVEALQERWREISDEQQRLQQRKSAQSERTRRRHRTRDQTYQATDIARKPSLTDSKGNYASFVGRRMTVTGRTLDGGRFELNPNRWTLVHFWATWCPSCRRHASELADIQRRFAEQGVDVVGVSLDADLPDLRRFNDRNGITWPQVVTHDVRRANWNTPLVKKYGIRSIPATFLLSPDGVVVEAGLRNADYIAHVLNYHGASSL